jgi:8-oxo-dGTP diphosphatase
MNKTSNHLKKIPLHVVFVEAWVRKDGKYLLAKRSSKDDQAAGKWAVPGGKVGMELEPEIIKNSLKREVMEEVGIEIKNIKFLTSRSFIRSSGHHVVALSFTADHKSGVTKPLEGQDEIRWVTVKQMEALLDDHWDGTLKALKKFDL